jgi:hypothetical protein
VTDELPAAILVEDRSDLSRAGSPFAPLLPIYHSCVELNVVKACVDLDTTKACASLSLLGLKLFEACSGWKKVGNLISTTIQSSTINSGIWKLEKPEFVIEYDLMTGEGTVKFSARLYQITLNGWIKKEEWKKTTIMHW